MSDEKESQAHNGCGEKKPFVEPEIKEFDDLENKIALIGYFTP